MLNRRSFLRHLAGAASLTPLAMGLAPGRAVAARAVLPVTSAAGPSRQLFAMLLGQTLRVSPVDGAGAASRLTLCELQDHDCSCDRVEQFVLYFDRLQGPPLDGNIQALDLGAAGRLPVHLEPLPRAEGEAPRYRAVFALLRD